VPLSQFIEPIYTGEKAGNMVAFAPEGVEFLWAAGIWEQWVSQTTGEVIESFAILTDAPIPFVAKVGHDRSPVFLRESDLGVWLGSPGRDPRLLLKEVLALRCVPLLRAEVDRPLAAGWEKRAKLS
jgi:putative SOS response-associated peptidase YedK